MRESLTDTGTMIIDGMIQRRPPGRPRGTNYDHLDEHVFYEIDRMMRQGKVQSLYAAYHAVADRAYGAEWLPAGAVVRRLQRSYPRHILRKNQQNTQQ